MNKLAIGLVAGMAVALPAYAAWYRDRDNSMVDANDEVGDAMAVILGGNGTVTQAIQVCEGVYLATAHGSLDNPVRAAEIEHRYRRPGKFGMRVVAYPMSRPNMTEALDESDYLSPRLRDPSLWESGHENSDYAFITVDEPPRPEAYITPLFLTPDDMIANRDKLDVFMYRGKSRYPLLPNGDLNFDEDAAIPRYDVRTLMTLYQEPQRVVQRCAVVIIPGSGLKGYIAHDCPTEQSASGASYITPINGVSYLVGLNVRGADANLDSMAAANGGSTALMSAAFCADYQTACGQPCARLADVLGQE